MQNLEALVKNLKALSLPMDTIDTDHLTENQREFFYRFCRQYDVKHSHIIAGEDLGGISDPMHY